MEDSAPAPSSPPEGEEVPPVSVAVPAEGESGSGASSPPPDAWAAILSFLDRPQEARQSALASLPTSDLIRLSLEASATALGRLSWYEEAPAAVSGDPIRNPPPGRLVLRAAPVAKEPPPKAMAPPPAHETAQVKTETSDAAPAPHTDSSNALPVAIPKTCPIPYPGTGNGAASSGAAPEPGQPGSSDDPGPVSAPSQTTRPKAPQPEPASRAAPEVVPDDSDDDSLWEAAWYGQLDPGHLGPNQYSWIDVRPHLPPLLRPFPDLFCLSPGGTHAGSSSVRIPPHRFPISGSVGTAPIPAPVFCPAPKAIDAWDCVCVRSWPAKEPATRSTSAIIALRGADPVTAPVLLLPK